VSFINLIISLTVCLLAWVLFLTHKLYKRTIVLRRKSSVLLIRAIKNENKFLKVLKITNYSLKGILIYRQIKALVETMKTASFLFCLVFKKR